MSENRGPSDSEKEACRWPIAYMNKEVYKKGEVIFKRGDKADKMFYIKSGSIRLPELDKVIGSNQIIGEMGVFSILKERTASAICEDDLEVYTMDREGIIKFFKDDPNLAIEVMQTSIQRFIENLKRETAERERIESELRIARDIQTSMLPQNFPPFPDRKEFEIFAIMDPAKEVGGDFYDFFFVDKERLFVTIGDVSGKGVPAALFMATTKVLLKAEALRGFNLDEVISRVNNLLCSENRACMFVTVFCMVLNTTTGELEFSNAGHNPPLICGEDRCFDFFSLPKSCVAGIVEDNKFICKKIMLKPNDIVFLYTDGVTEAMDNQKRLFSEVRLKETLEKVRSRYSRVKDIVIAVRQEIDNFANGAPQSDDITMVALKFFGKGV
ncbi:MAG: PP2C family protein-serine/threonine phosphatase [Candidatus Omnitrophica bacterium]|nr:PP2C family protein-serine/threonine phosphatase [Candidatus Omnitrophota bacterium]